MIPNEHDDIARKIEENKVHDHNHSHKDHDDSHSHLAHSCHSNDNNETLNSNISMTEYK